jgi:hypothetical protein
MDIETIRHDQQVDMEYNTSRERMIIPEYGRNVQRMVDYLLTLEDRDERNKQAQNLIAIIANLNPQVYETDEDPDHKLWDHLHIMSDFKLDVDAPYPPPAPESLLEKPGEVDYPVVSRRFRHYGKITRQMIEYAIKLPEGEEKKALTESVANVMKKNYLIWNKDNVDDAVILENLKVLSDGQLDLSDINFADKRELVPQTGNSNTTNHKKNWKRSNNNNNNNFKRKNNKHKN